jgi:hypothetical protein
MERCSGSSLSEGYKPEPSFPGTGIANTTPLQLNFGAFFVFWNFFFFKEK